MSVLFSDLKVAALGQKMSPKARKLNNQVKGLKANWAHAKAGGKDEDVEEESDPGVQQNLVGPYFEWMPGNLVVGPEGAVRKADPKEKYDAEAATALTSAHRETLENAYAKMKIATGTGAKKDRKPTAGEAAELVRNIATLPKTVPPIWYGQGDAPTAPYWKNPGEGWEIEPRP